MDPPPLILVEQANTQSSKPTDSLDEATPSQGYGRRRISRQTVLHSGSLSDGDTHKGGLEDTNRGSMEDGEKVLAFPKLVKTVQFIKKWAGRAKQPHDDRDEFLGRLKLTGPNIDEVYDTAKERGVADEEEKEEGQTLFRSKKKLKQYLLWNPTGRWLYMWMLVVTMAVLYNAIMIIARETFDHFHDILLPLWLVLDYTADLIYILDMLVQIFTSYLEQGLLVTDLRLVAVRYMKTHYFIIDIVSIIPFDILYVIPGVGLGHTIIRLNRLLRIHRMLQFFDRTESRTNYPNLFRVVMLILLITILIHWNACFYFLISESLGFGSDTWVYPAIIDEHGNLTEFSTLTRQYLFSFYWSTLTLTTIGELPGPVRDEEFVFVIFDFLVGVLIFATIVGMVGGIITNMNIRRTEFQENLDNLKQYMRYRRVGKELQDRVIKWFDYLWTNNHSLNEEKIVQSLPDKLQTEIAIHVHFETLRQVKIFEECEAGLLEELVLKLKPQVFSPGDYICRKGDIGKEMYIIKHGRLEVVGDNGHTVLATLTDGGYFGEISILNLGGSGNRRTANVRSVGYSDLFCLSKSDLLETLTEYPETKALLEERGKKTLMRDGPIGDRQSYNELETVDDVRKGWSVPTNKMETTTLENKVEQLELNLEKLQSRFVRLLGEYNTAQRKLKQRLHALETK